MSVAPAEAATAVPTYADVLRAAERIAGVAHKTPVLTSRTADARTGAQLFFKCENYQRGGAFKFRGGYNAIAALPETVRGRGVIASSSGNHAQAVAAAGALLGAPATILMPDDAPAAKLAATRGYGAEVLTFDRYKVDRAALAARLADERGASFIPPYDHPDVIAGQGTAAKELIEEVGELDVLLVGLSGGGLLAGSALAAEALAPRCAVYGVEPEVGNDGQQSLRAGRRIAIPVPKTIADGATSSELGALNFEVLRRSVKDVVTISDADLVRAMRFFAERMKMVVEPTGCLAAAAALTAAVPIAGKRVGIIVSGGNVDLAAYAALLTDPMIS